MKIYKYLITIIAFAGLLISGCSDKSQSPLDPAEQGSLGKATITNITALSYPTGLIKEGEEKLAAGNLIVRDMIASIRWESENQLVNADGILTLNSNLDAVTGEGHYWGTLTLTPNEAAGGEWIVTWNGKCTQTGETEWTLPLKMVGHGRGGSIDGMYLFVENIVTYDAPFPEFWLGNVTGYIKSH